MEKKFESVLSEQEVVDALNKHNFENKFSNRFIFKLGVQHALAKLQPQLDAIGAGGVSSIRITSGYRTKEQNEIARTGVYGLGACSAVGVLGGSISEWVRKAQSIEEAAQKEKHSGEAPIYAELLAMSCGYPLSPESFIEMARDVIDLYKRKNAASITAGELGAALNVCKPALPGSVRVGRLPTMNQDEYPDLGDWWVQLRIGPEFDEVLARVYGDSPLHATDRANAIAAAIAAALAAMNSKPMQDKNGGE